ncbi:hypothetical protein ACFSX9_08660 [Flavobacterium ardleyense]|uniref:Lipoprotein n=1 Tax=Flavobacterium ardleyense TaxID=2038737 RepID=A0ABW5ZAI9_9FLAO
MKTIKLNKLYIAKPIFAMLFALSFTFMSCDSNDDNDVTNTPPTAMEFNSIREIALDNATQNFQIVAANGTTTLNSANGVEIDINASCLTLNGNPVNGLIDIKYIEIFDGGDMLVTNKTTMGKLPNGDMAMIITGGAFYINATQNGQQLVLNCGMNLRIPANLTAPDPDMILWDGTINAAGDLVWEEQGQDATGRDNLFLEGPAGNPTYYAFFNSFGWTNVDKFYDFSGPKTQILASVPAGYNYDNSAVYLHYDGEGNALAKLDTYSATTKLFSEHYGQIPVGLPCHIIFASEDNGQWRYAIKSVTISDNAVYNFTLSETVVGSEAQLIAAINALP